MVRKPIKPSVLHALFARSPPAVGEARPAATEGGVGALALLASLRRPPTREGR